jgi:LPXTG-motif cell wall-anchored protein
MSQDFNDFDTTTVEEAPAPASSGNRNFVVAIGIIAGIFVLLIIAMAVFLLVWLPKQKEARNSQALAINMANTQTVAAATSAALQKPASTFTKAPAKVLPPTQTQTPLPKATSVVAVPSATMTATSTVSPLEPKTATVAALLTQAAEAKLTSTFLPTTTKLPQTGFADQVGLPGLLGLALLLVAVIFLARRMRSSTAG